MFPGAGATVYYNEAGEPTGWSYENDYEPDYDPYEYPYDDDGPYPGCCDDGDWDGPRSDRPNDPWTCAHCGKPVPTPKPFERW